MAIVDDYIKCERCSGVVWIEHNCNNDEIREQCLHCGSGYSHALKRDAADNPIKVDGKYQYSENRWIGRGSFMIRPIQGIGSGGIFSLEEDLQKIKDWVKELETDDNINPKDSYVLLFDGESKQFELLFGTMPKLWDAEFT